MFKNICLRRSLTGLLRGGFVRVMPHGSGNIFKGSSVFSDLGELNNSHKSKLFMFK